MNHCVIETPAGRLTIWELQGCITEAAFGNAPLRAPETPLLQEAVKEIEEYFQGRRREFDLPIAAPGDPLAQKVWAALLDIPYGKTVTAAKLAARLKASRYLRAIIKIINHNPVAIFLPCHRVVSEEGEGGYVGGAEVKHVLWQVEGIQAIKK